VAVNVVADDPVEKLARLLSPGDDPAVIRYDAGGHPLAGAVQPSATVAPATVAVNPIGAEESAEQASVACGRTTTSLEETLVPFAFLVRTRRKYVRGASAVAVSVADADPVSAFARSASPLDNPASST
jgi:hypothetical protein